MSTIVRKNKSKMTGTLINNVNEQIFQNAVHYRALKVFGTKGYQWGLRITQ